MSVFGGDVVETWIATALVEWLKQTKALWVIVWYVDRKVDLSFLHVQVFPLDYVLITIITMYFVFTSMAGIRNMGIWFFWMRVSYPHFFNSTCPQINLDYKIIFPALIFVVYTSLYNINQVCISFVFKAKSDLQYNEDFWILLILYW